MKSRTLKGRIPSIIIHGNSVRIVWFDKKSNLHEIWDNEIIRKANLSEKEYAEELDTLLNSQDARKIRTGTIVGWANQCHEIARVCAYPQNIKNDNALGISYFTMNRSVVNQQLATAGVRLAEVLSDIFDRDTGRQRKTSTAFSH
jgi:hypothetical protein